MKKRILLGTKNQAKIDDVRAFLRPLPVKVLSLKDLSIEKEVDENGQSPEENAGLKARAYFSASCIPTLAIDAGLRIEKFPEEKQPGVYVRRVRGAGQDVTDGELIEYYIQELDRVGGESPGSWTVALVLMVSADKVFSHSFSLETLFTANIGSESRWGAPLSSLMIDPATGLYYSEMTQEERPDAKWICGFVERHLEAL